MRGKTIALVLVITAAIMALAFVLAALYFAKTKKLIGAGDPATVAGGAAAFVPR